MSDPFKQTMTAPFTGELIRKGRERALRRRVDLLNRIWWATRGSNLSSGVESRCTDIARSGEQRETRPERKPASANETVSLMRSHGALKQQE